jgi:hypothetical protein
MPWSLSHTADGIDNASDQIRAIDSETLRTIYAEWMAFEAQRDDPEWSGDDAPDHFDQNAHERARAHADALPHDTLVDVVEAYALDHGTCDSGGFHLWICPYGCHKVGFDPIDPTTE